MAKLKSGNAIVRLLLSHGEKLGIVAILVCAGMLVWSGMGLEKLGSDRKPDDLRQLTSRASQNIDRATWESVDPNNKLIADPVIADAMAKINHEHFPVLDHSLDRPPLNPTMLRRDPALLTVEDLEVNGDSGLWASADPDVIERNRLRAMEAQQEREAAEARAAESDDDERTERGGLLGRESAVRQRDRRPGGRREEDDTKPRRREGPVIITSSGRSQLQGFEEIRAESWVTVVGKIPIKQQFEFYKSALEETKGYDPQRDLPIYVGAYVERAEVTAAGTGEWTKIPTINEKNLLRKTESYPSLGAEPLVPSHYSHNLLTHPLPPLILREWDRRVTHSSIPTVEEEMVAELEEFRKLEEAGEELPEDGDEFSRRGAEDRFPGRFEEGDNPRRAFGPGIRRPDTMRRSRAMPRAQRRFAGPGGAMPGMGERGQASLGEFVWDFETSHILFRYFDNDVEPGGRYRYRVRLAIRDVNAKVPEQRLDKTVIERQKSENHKSFRLTEWSKPSPIASVPLPARVYLAGVKAVKERGGSFDGEPEANMLVKVFDYKLPGELAHKVESLRGTVLNPKEKASVIWTQSSQTQTDEDTEKFDKEFLFRTGITVLDMRGGQEMKGKRTKMIRPASVLMMGPSGRLFVQEELDDLESTKEYDVALESGEDGRSFRRGGVGMYGDFE